MRARLALVLALGACGGSVTAPPLVMQTEPRDDLELAPTAPYARLFGKDAHWEFPATAWLGAGPPPTITCTVEGQRAFERARVGYLHCAADRDLGPLSVALPRFGIIATAAGLWFTEHLTTVSPVPDTEDAALVWAKDEPMRLAAKPAPLSYQAHADATADADAIDGRIEAFAHGDAWCVATQNALGGDAGQVLLCLRAGDGIVGGGVAMVSRGIVTGALSFGDAPPPPESQPFHTDLDIDPVTVTLNAPGKGKRAPLVLDAAPASTQPVAFQVSAHAISDDGDGKPPAEADQPTLDLRGTAEVAAVEADGRYHYAFTVAQATATGAGVTPALTSGVGSMVGAVFAGTVSPDGRQLASAVDVPHPIATTPLVVAQLAQSMSMFVALPVEPIAVGATWTATYPSHILGQAVQVTVRSRLASRKGAVAVVTSDTAIAPIAQPVNGGTGKLEARGTITTVITKGRLVPTRAEELHLVATVEPTAGVANPARKERHELRMRMRVVPQ